jgi:hypothetical protein
MGVVALREQRVVDTSGVSVRSCLLASICDKGQEQGMKQSIFACVVGVQCV